MAHRVYNRRAARRKQEQRTQMIERIFGSLVLTLAAFIAVAAMFAAFHHTFGV